MVIEIAPLLLVGLVGAVVLAGAITGIAGFGFALVGTMVLATVIDPATAVVVLIAPILAVNLSLVGELTFEDVISCTQRFWPLVLFAFVGTLGGMALLDWLPQGPLEVALGIVALAYVGVAQRLVPLPGITALQDGCFVERGPAMAGVGAVSGVLFGGTNVGVQFVAYLRSCELPHSTFVGVVALLFLGINTLRMGVAGVLGLYTSWAVVAISLAAGLPAVIGVAVGKWIRPHISTSMRRWLVLALLFATGIVLVAGGTV